MIGPHYKPISLHKDAKKVYDTSIASYEQLRSIYDGLTWLISNNYKIGTNVLKNYFLIKSSEKIPKWHQQNLPMNKLPTITLLYSVEEDSIIIEGINLRS